MSEQRFSPATVLVTGGAGFIGGNLVRWLLATEPELRVINLDLLTYAGNLESLDDVECAHGAQGDGRYTFVKGDIRDDTLVARLLAGNRLDGGPPLSPPDAILHLAAESHVDRSIAAPAEFVSTNVLGTHCLLAAAQAEVSARPRPFRFVNVSTDEVYGSLGPAEDAFSETHPLRPNSPYSASKAGADCLVRAYAETFGLDGITTRCSNNYGEYQFPEKLMPLMITRALRDEPLPVYGDGGNVRDWLYVRDHAAAIWRVCTHGRCEDEVYNIGGNAERTNLEVVRAILALLGKSESLITFVRDRPGHDRRYAMNASRMADRLAWRPTHSFEQGLAETVEWYRAHRSWWERMSGEAHPAARSHYA